MTLLLGIDSGLTVTKAVLFDEHGKPVGYAAANTPVTAAYPGWQERDMCELWTITAETIRRCLCATTPQVDPADIAAIGMSGHSDGLYAVDGAGQPARPSISATDSRAHMYVQRYREDGIAAQALELTGQVPFSASPASVNAWLRDQRPEEFDRVRWFLGCKDWLRYQLTGQIATDPSEASTSFVDVSTHQYTQRAFDLFGLQAVADRVPPILGSATVSGVVTSSASEATGLRTGTPVVTGAHDVDASALGMAAISPGMFSVIMGTFSINQVVSDTARLDDRWQARSFIRPGNWLHMSTSPSSTSNLTWATQLLGPLDSSGRPDFAEAVRVAISVDPTRAPLFRPFLYGSPDGRVGAAFSGVIGEHGRDQLLRSVLDGIVFNHRYHLDCLREQFAAAGPIHLGGGGARSAGLCQLLSDATGLPVLVSDADEVGARGAAMLAAVGAGVQPDLEGAAKHMVRVSATYEPSPSPQLEERYGEYLELARQ